MCAYQYPSAVRLCRLKRIWQNGTLDHRCAHHVLLSTILDLYTVRSALQPPSPSAGQIVQRSRTAQEHSLLFWPPLLIGHTGKRGWWAISYPRHGGTRGSRHRRMDHLCPGASNLETSCILQTAARGPLNEQSTTTYFPDRDGEITFSLTPNHHGAHDSDPG